MANNGESGSSGRIPARTARTLPAVLLTVVLAAVLAGCPAGNGNGNGDGGSRETERSPFTGERVEEPSAPVLAVKIDNARSARPHTGLDAADLVYVEQVEWGLTRLLTVFSSELPSSVGPVRSAREADIELLRQFGEPALAYSGAQSRLIPVLEDSPLHLLPPSEAPDAYSRSAERPAPHNLYLDPEAALRAAPEEVSGADDIGFRFGPAPEGGRAVTEETVRFPGARYTFTWSADEERWLVSMDGDPARTADGDRLGAPTVVIQRVEIRDSRFRDRGGGVSPYSETVGSGEATVLRGGRAYEARWSRLSPDSGTEFTTPDGERLNFARGQVWVVLAPR
ncbi:DUF3048 domain-containing protein [Streptomyces sp. TRM 70361]|uniref:DUF3048 domain-containing protein n=1 Tax=Streptomyces sp. TRM 70361 TaxID=3116553 RepID=UPI002E7B346F|nr:DUF3048 domain-containing protein [Streptomyces sp. TRM 70361]MEE1942859.1 DUF3048 domain-containing protein [Streptomyces sp. TRM 70361]